MHGSSNFCCGLLWMLHDRRLMCCSLSNMMPLPHGITKQMHVVQDIFTLFHLNRPFKFVSKTSNFLIPIIGWSMFLTGESRCSVHSYQTILMQLHQRLALSAHLFLLSVLLQPSSSCCLFCYSQALPAVCSVTAKHANKLTNCQHHNCCLQHNSVDNTGSQLNLYTPESRGTQACND